MPTYTETLNLDSYQYYIDLPVNDNTYFNLRGFPSLLSYGKHPFILTFNQPENSPPLKIGTTLLFEFVDSKGLIIYTELTNVLSGGANGFAWIQKNPLRSSVEVNDGPAQFQIVASLDDDSVPSEFANSYNIRSTFEFEIRKDYQNLSPIVFSTPSDLQIGSNFSESIDFDSNDLVVSRSYVNVSASNLQTNGGQVRFVELSYKESNSQANEYSTLSTYELSGSNYEVPIVDSAGLNVVSHEYKVPVPTDFRRDTPVTFRLRFKNPNDEVAQYYTGSLLNTDIEVTSSEMIFTSSATFIEGTDNLLSGSLYTGDGVGSGFEMSGRDGGAYLKSKEYTGFSNSNTGVMLFSGSVLPSATTDDYKGVGLELYGSANSFLKFRSIPSELEIRTDKFFVGNSTTQFISGANNNIEISSSDFHLDPNNDTLIIGANATINAGLTVNSLRTPATIGGAASNAQNASSSIDSKGFARFVSASIGSFGVSDNAFFSPPDDPVTPNFFISGAATNNEFFISSSNFQVQADGDVFAKNLTMTGGSIGSGVTILQTLTADSIRTPSTVGGNPATAENASSSIDSDGFARFQSASIAGFDISPIAIASSNDNLILSSSGRITASAAKINGDITATKGSFGGITIDSTGINSDSHQLSITGSTGQLTASAAKISGNITATTGQIGGITIKNAGIHSDSHQLSITGSTGQITASAAKLTSADVSGKISADSGDIGGFSISSVGLNSDSHQLSITGSTGQITASAAKLTSADISGKVTADEGSIGGITIKSGGIHSDSHQLSITGSTGQITASAAKLTGNITATSGEIGGFNIATALESTQGNLILKGGTGQITASAAKIAGNITATSGSIGGWSIDTDAIYRGTKGSNNTYTTDAGDITFGAGFISSKQFLIDTDGNAKFKGDLTGASGVFSSTIKIGNKALFTADGNDGVFISSDGIALGDANQFQVTDEGALTATSGQIGGFTIQTSALKSGTDSDFVQISPSSGIQLGDSTFVDAPFSVTNAGVLKAASGTVGGWTIGSSTIVGSNLTFSNTGVIETNDFASGVKGFRLDSAGNGIAEFNNVTIRGTLSTTTFEKETVSAVGGQLYVGNSTTITGSSDVTLSDTTMSIANAAGFVVGEILTAKKQTSTGFSTEYIKIESSSLDDPSSNNNFVGKIYVERGLGTSPTAGTDSSSLGDEASSATSYQPGQVLVSTGKSGTGYVRINANPSDLSTPYMDIVERTGTGVYDVSPKVRLGDLSGLSREKLHGTDPATAGFGLYSQNVFLEGGIVANTGSIGGIKMQSNKLFTGVGTFGTADTGVYLDSSGQFSLKDKFKWDNSTLTITGSLAISDGDVSKSLASINTTTQSINLGITSLNNTTGSHNARISAIEIETGSINLSVSSIESTTSSLNQTTGSLNTETGSLQNSLNSQNARIAKIELTTGSINLSVSALEATTASLNTETGSLQSSITTQDARLAEIELTTGSINLSVSAIESATASLNTTTGSLNTSIATQNQRLADIELTTGSINLSVSAIESATASLNTTTGSLNTSIATQDARLADIELTTGSINLSVSAIETATASLNTTTGSLNTSIATQDARLADIELTTGSINLSVSAIETATASLNTTTGSLNNSITTQDARLAEIELTTGSINLSVTSIESVTSSLNQATASLNDRTGSHDTRISAIEVDNTGISLSVTSILTATSSLNQATGSLNQTTSSLNQTTGSLNQTTGSLNTTTGSLNTTTGSLNTTTGSLNQTTGSLNTTTGSLNDTTGSLNQTTGSLNDTTGSLEQATGSLEQATGSLQEATASLEQATGSLQEATASQEIRIAAVELSTTNIGLSVGAINDDTASYFTSLNINQSGVQISGSRLEFSGSTFVFGNKSLGAGSQFISGSAGELEISSSNFHLKGGNITASNVDLSGKISAQSGDIGGFSINPTAISSSNNNLILKSDGQITASDALLQGKLTAATVSYTHLRAHETSLHLV